MNRQDFIEKFEKGLESDLLFYLSDNILKWRNNPLPINIKQFYVTQAVKYLPSFKNQTHRKLLMSSLTGLGSKRIH